MTNYIPPDIKTLVPVIGLVTLGDSITDGTASGLDKNQRWPDSWHDDSPKPVSESR